MRLVKHIRIIGLHIAVYVVIVGIVLAGSVLLRTFGPPRFIYTDNSWDNVSPYILETEVQYDVLLDQHSHTKYSDGKLTVKQNIEWHIALGFTVVVITDHNTLKNSEEIQMFADVYKNECIVIQGMEWTTNRVHLSLIGIKEWNLKIPRNPTDQEIRQTIDEVHRQNGTVTFNHPGFTRRIADQSVPSNAELMSWGVDFIEVINGVDFDEDSYDFVQQHNDTIGMISGTDMHSPQPEDGGRVHAWTALNVTSFSEEAIMDELRLHRTTVVTNQFGIERHGKSEYNKYYDFLSLFYNLGDVMIFYQLRNDQSYDGFGRIILNVFLSYSALIFVVVEVVLGFRRSLKNPKN